MHGVSDVRHTEIHTAEPLVKEKSAFEFNMAIDKLKRQKSPGTDHIPTELIMAGDIKFRSDIHKYIDSIWNNEKLPEKLKESLIVPVYSKGDKTHCSNYRDTSLLSITYKILSNILLSTLPPYAEEIITYHQGGFRHNDSTNDHIF
jgi:hypothetical protein